MAFLFAQFGINIAGNAVSGGIDLASMFPKYINLRRGAYIVSDKFSPYILKKAYQQTTAMALPMCPWALLSGATVFISVMGGYATFLAPICGLMVTDYLLIRKSQVKLSSLVSISSGSGWYGTDQSVRLRSQFRILLLERSQLASTCSLGLWSSSSFPWILGNGRNSRYSSRSNEGILPLFPTYV
jgi:cytosine/uracil/thiamine/allantoin permease